MLSLVTLPKTADNTTQRVDLIREAFMTRLPLTVRAGIPDPHSMTQDEFLKKVDTLYDIHKLKSSTQKVGAATKKDDNENETDSDFEDNCGLAALICINRSKFFRVPPRQ